MKALLSTTFIAACIALNGQISITSEDLPVAGSSFTFMTASDFTGNNPEDTGPAYTWDYSGLVDLLPINEDYVTVSEAPITYQFLFNNPFLPEYDASMSIERLNQQIGDQITVDDFYEFLRADQSAYMRLGAGLALNGASLVARYQPIDTLMSLPATYGNTGGGYSEFYVEVPFLGSYLSQQTRNYTIDGWGTLITPYGSFETIRVKTTLNVRDSISITNFGINQAFDRPLTTEYAWYAAGEGVPVLLLRSTAGFNVTAQYKTTYIPAGIEEVKNEQLSIWPVPAKDNIIIDLLSVEPGNTWHIIDSRGSSVSRGQLTDSSRLQIDVSSLAPGTYTLMLEGGKNHQSQRFIVE
jgi:hypothetical protein